LIHFMDTSKNQGGQKRDPANYWLIIKFYYTMINLIIKIAYNRIQPYNYSCMIKF